MKATLTASRGAATHRLYRLPEQSSERDGTSASAAAYLTSSRRYGGEMPKYSAISCHRLPTNVFVSCRAAELAAAWRAAPLQRTLRIALPSFSEESLGERDARSFYVRNITRRLSACRHGPLRRPG